MGCIKLKYVFFILVFLMSFTACAKNSNSNKEENNSQDNIKLYLYIDETGKNDLLGAIERYNKLNKIKIVHEDFLERQGQEYLEKLSIGLMSGEGPDIPIIEKGAISSISKVLQSEIFYDINKLIPGDKKFNLSDYNKKVLDSGIYQGKRYLVPLGYNMLTFFANKGNLEKNNIKFDESKWSWENFADIVEKFMEDNKGKNRYFFSPSTYRLFDALVQCRGVSFISTSKKKSRFNSPEFIETLKIFKDKIYPGIIPDEIIMSDPNSTTKVILNNSNLFYKSKWFSNSNNVKREFYTMPTYTGEKVIILDPCYSVAIASKCKYKKEAFEFIKILLSEDTQKQSIFLPVNRKAYESNVDFYLENIGTGSYYTPANDSNEIEKRRDMINAQTKVIEEISQCEMIDYAVFDIVNNELPDFLKGSKTAEQTAQIIDDKVNLYLNE